MIEPVQLVQRDGSILECVLLDHKDGLYLVQTPGSEAPGVVPDYMVVAVLTGSDRRYYRHD